MLRPARGVVMVILRPSNAGSRAEQAKNAPQIVRKAPIRNRHAGATITWRFQQGCMPELKHS